VKIAVSGKGGVGKTTLSAGLARHWAAQGRRVVAIDADPDANLAVALGATPEQDAACVPLSHMDDLIEERTGARPGAGGMFRMNPDVSDVVERCGVQVEGVTLLRMGTVERGGSGCMCSEGVFLKAFMHELLVRRQDVAVLDMEAGVEHLGRGTADSVDAFVVVVEPTSRSVQTAHAVARLAGDIGVRRVVAVGNKLRDADDEAYLRDALGEVTLLATIPHSDAVRRADREGRSPFDADLGFATAIDAVGQALTERVMDSSD
jgi:CO dehydrogenase maturation factor